MGYPQVLPINAHNLVGFAAQQQLKSARSNDDLIDEVLNIWEKRTSDIYCIRYENCLLCDFPTYKDTGILSGGCNLNFSRLAEANGDIAYCLDLFEYALGRRRSTHGPDNA